MPGFHPIPNSYLHSKRVQSSKMLGVNIMETSPGSSTPPHHSVFTSWRECWGEKNPHYHPHRSVSLELVSTTSHVYSRLEIWLFCRLGDVTQHRITHRFVPSLVFLWRGSVSAVCALPEHEAQTLKNRGLVTFLKIHTLLMLSYSDLWSSNTKMYSSAALFYMHGQS